MSGTEGFSFNYAVASLGGISSVPGPAAGAGMPGLIYGMWWPSRLVAAAETHIRPARGIFSSALNFRRSAIAALNPRICLSAGASRKCHGNI
jgi:hypothetical protein